MTTTVTTADRRLIDEPYGDDLDLLESRIQQIVERLFLDDDHLVRGAIKGSTLRPYTSQDMKGVPLERTIAADLGSPHRYKLLWMNYEETGMAQGDWLMAMLDKAVVTRSANATRRAKEAFGAIRKLADTVARSNPYGRGWWPKPYGGMSDLNEMFETSIDQVVKIVLALSRYEQWTPRAAERNWCHMQVRAMADWWSRHHFTTRYFGNCCWWDLHESPHSAAGLLYLVRQALTWAPGRAPKHLCQAWEHLRSNRRWMLFKRGGPNSYNLAFECAQRLDEIDFEDSRFWRRAGRTILTHALAETDMTTGTNIVPGYGRYNTGLRTACTAAAAHVWFGNRPAEKVATQLLRIFNRADKFYHHDQTHPNSSATSVSWWRDARSGHFYVAWLAAYWRLERGV